MGKIIAFYSYAKKSGKTTIAFNIANILASQNYKTLILELHYESTYYKTLNLKDNILKTQNIFKHFTLHNLENNLSVVCLQETINDNEEWFDEQIIKWKNTYDYILVELSWLQNNLWNYLLNKIDKFICIFDAINFTSDILVKTLAATNKLKKISTKLKYDLVILNKHIEHTVNSVTALTQLSKIFINPNQLKILTFENKISLDYSIKEPWTKYAIDLNEIIKLL